MQASGQDRLLVWGLRRQSEGQVRLLTDPSSEKSQDACKAVPTQYCCLGTLNIERQPDQTLKPRGHQIYLEHDSSPAPLISPSTGPGLKLLLSLVLGISYPCFKFWGLYDLKS